MSSGTSLWNTSLWNESSGSRASCKLVLLEPRGDTLPSGTVAATLQRLLCLPDVMVPEVGSTRCKRFGIFVLAVAFVRLINIAIHLPGAGWLQSMDMPVHGVCIGQSRAGSGTSLVSSSRSRSLLGSGSCGTGS
ncbi:hypothetical protein E4U55_002020 [Claviceps digitariae]|nr:hypothetical protein E4U55_002020 [Claviceps digitariae]